MTARMTSALPIIDFGDFSKSLECRQKIATHIDAACRADGFFFIENHGVDHAVIDAAFAESKKFFNLPTAEKSKIAIENSPCHRGWFGRGGEVLDAVLQPQGDMKEGLKIGRDLPPSHRRVREQLPLHGPNQWPKNNPQFKSAMQECYAAFEKLAHELMQVFALALGLPQEHFESVLTLPMATLAPLRYPPLPKITDTSLSAGAHTDFGCLTLLAQRDVAGLEIAAPNGDWQKIPADTERLVVNIGDMLARWTNDRYRSTRHRVVNRTKKTRHSLAYFFDPDPHADLTPLPGCITPDASPHYPPATCLSHLLEKIDASFAYRQSD